MTSGRILTSVSSPALATLQVTVEMLDELAEREAGLGQALVVPTVPGAGQRDEVTPEGAVPIRLGSE